MKKNLCKNCLGKLSNWAYKIQKVHREQNGNVLARVITWRTKKTIYLCKHCWDNYIDFSKVVVFLVVLTLSSLTSAHAIPENKAVRAIIGEAADQGYRGMLAVACAIRNRGHLKGVYGLKAKHVDSEPEWIWNIAKIAWQESASCDIVNGATHWENLTYGTPYWAKSM